MRTESLVTRNEVYGGSDSAGVWDSIITDDSVKSRLLRGAVLSLTIRPKVPFHVSALHGLAVLSGPPGTGKTTLARALAPRLASMLGTKHVRLIEIDPHGLMSAEHGQSQQRVTELLTQTVPQLASDRVPTILLLDEVESMAVARSAASLSANPADVHRATDAVLTALDSNAGSSPHIFTVATTNFAEALDSAFLSRADVHIDMPIPPAEAVLQILQAALRGFGSAFPSLEKLAASPRLPEVARILTGRDGREIRKSVTEAMLYRQETTIDPNRLTVDDLVAAARMAER